MTDRRDVPTVLTAAALMTWFWVTAAGSHADRTFDRFRAMDRTGVLIPDWRFFAPTPGMFDVHLIYRFRAADGAITDWDHAVPIAPRHWRQTLWFPFRRRNKLIFDLSSVVETQVATLGLTKVAETRPYRALSELVAAHVHAQHGTGPLGFQFALVKGTGHDEDSEPEYLLQSAYVPLA